MTIRNAPRAIWFRGTFWPVSPLFWEQAVAPYPELEDMDWSAIDEARVDLVRESEYRRLTPEEYDRLRALDWHWNVRSNIVFLNGRGCGEFGFAFYDQCHGWRGDMECGCSLHAVFDDHVAAALSATGGTITLHPHYPRSVCAGHQHLRHDPVALHAAHGLDAAMIPALTD